MVCCATVNVVSSVAEHVQLAATLTPDGPVQLIIDFVTPKINPFLSHLLSLPLSPTFRSNHPLSEVSDQEVSFQAPSSPGLVGLSVTVSQRDVSCSATGQNEAAPLAVISTKR